MSPRSRSVTVCKPGPADGASPAGQYVCGEAFRDPRDTDGTDSEI